MSRKRKPTGPFTRSEALELLSTHLRKPDLAPNVLVKLTALYARLANWKATDDPSDDEEETISKLVAQAERKRREVQ